MQKLALRTEHLTELAPDTLRRLVAGGPRGDSESCTCVSITCGLAPVGVLEVSICCDLEIETLQVR